MSISEMRERNVPLADVVETFCRANYDLSPKTERWYRQNLGAFLRFVEQVRDHTPTLADLDKPIVDAFLKRRRSIPTLKYPSGSAFAVRAAAVTLKRFANWSAPHHR